MRHSAASKSAVHYTWAKTKVDKETIYGILKELNKEGRKLDAPELAEVNAFLDKEEFKARLDPELSEKDRKMILKNLEKARLEAEKDPVSPGAWHAWKNLMSKTIERIKKPLMAAGLAGVLAFTVAGCTNSMPDPDKTPPAPTDTVACSTEDAGPWGDVIMNKPVKDELGEYCSVKIDPNSDALKYDASKTDMASLEANGFTEADAKEAQKAAVKMLTEVTLDSSRLDNHTQSDTDWLNENKSLVNPAYIDSFAKSASSDELYTTGFVISKGIPSPVVRDGGPRANSINIEVTAIHAGPDNLSGKPNLIVTLASTAVYPAKDSAIVEAVIKNNPGTTEESLKASTPELFDDKTQESDVIVQGHFVYGFADGNYTQLAGTATNYTINTSYKTPILE